MSEQRTTITSSKELAEQLGCSERYLKKLARDTGHCRTFGHKVFFTQQDLDALMEHLKPVARNPYLALKGKTQTTKEPKKKPAKGNIVEDALAFLRAQHEEDKKNSRR